MKWAKLYCSLNILWHCLFGIGMNIGLFQSCYLSWVFQICWHIECSAFTESSCRIRNSSTGTPSPPLVLFLVMPPKAHLTSHTKMSGCRWVTTPSWLFGSLRSFCTVLYILTTSSSLLHLLGPYSFCPLLYPSLHEIVLWYLPVFLKRYLIILILLFSSISLHCLFKKAFLSPLAILWNFAFSCRIHPWYPLLFIPQLFVKPPQTTTLSSWIYFPLEWFWSLPPM